jgi:hypothetical protein
MLLNWYCIVRESTAGTVDTESVNVLLDTDTVSVATSPAL